MTSTSQEAATLLDILIDGFEKNESFRGFHQRELPMPGEEAAARKFGALVEEGDVGRGRLCDGMKTRCDGSRHGPIWRFVRPGAG